MAGLRMVWIDEARRRAGPLARAAYRRMGHWAFTHSPEWLAFIYARDWERLNLLATSLTASFANPPTPAGAPNAAPRVLILYDAQGPLDVTDPNVTAYHGKHSLLIVEDGTLTSSLVFKGDPTSLDFESYMGEYGTDDGEGGTNIARAERFFAMGLMTRCR